MKRNEGNEYSDSYTAKQYAVGQGVPEGDILLEEESTITQENIEYAKSYGWRYGGFGYAKEEEI